LAILLTVGGTPCIYAGDEQAFRGIKENRAGGDDEIRPTFPSCPDEMSSSGWGVYRLHQQLIGLRRRHPWLRQARSQILHLKNRHMVMVVSAEGSSLVVALNLDDKEVALPTPDAQAVLAGNGRLRDRNASSANIDVPAHGWVVLSTCPAR
jgi:cyclomaltodextrinase